MAEPVTAAIALGANLGDRESNIREALRLLDAHDAIRVVRVSDLMENEAVGSPAEAPSFLNGVALLETTLTPGELLAVLLDVERNLGRERGERNAPRTLELDLLLYGDRVIDQPGLQVPHPRMHERTFVLWPLLQVAPKAADPRTGEPYAEAYHRLIGKADAQGRR
jgi:2-amino-4-hydroxy-6-hydroxymethyldihydropteridine diphosphokinase